MVAGRKVVLTDRALKALKPAPQGRRVIVWDATQPHLGIRITDSHDDKGKAAVRSFIVVKRIPGKRDPVTHVIGAYNPHAKPSAEGSLAWARDRAREALEIIMSGRVPREAAVEVRQEAEAERRRKEEQAEGERRFGDVILNDYIDELKGLRAGGFIEATLRREFLGQVSERVKRDGEWVTEWKDGTDPIWRSTPVAEIAKRTVRQRLDEIKRRGGLHAARHALAAIRKFFAWCADGERYGIEVSPCAGITERTIGFSKDRRELRRKRVLSDHELVDVWAAAKHIGYPFGDAVRLLALTGQRLNDIVSARWSEFDLDAAMLVVPGERYKTGDAHEVPLAPKAVEIIRSLPRFSGPFVFSTTTGARPISGFNKMKARLDDVIAKWRQERGDEAIEAWRIHDIRRTVRTRLGGDCAVDDFIAERVIGHAMPGLHKIYDQGKHRGAKRAALETWEERLLSIVEPPKQPARGKVVPAAEVEKQRGRRRAAR